MGLRHPADLAAWQRWQDGRHPRPAIKRRALRLVGGRHGGVLHRHDDEPTLLVALDSDSPTSLAALVSPLEHLPVDRIAVLAPRDVTHRLPGERWHTEEWREGNPLPRVSGVLSTGHFLPLGGHAASWADQLGVPFITVQHGLLTPSAPPLAPGTILLAWTTEDAVFWCSGRSDVSVQVVGAELLRDAADRGPVEVSDERPIFLGQLHGAELPRTLMARTALDLCLETGATYRPHPGERDRASTALHAAWAARGVEIDDGGQPVTDLGRPVVSIFSTGVLEAAARGLPAYVTCADPPAWLEEFWDRYGLGRWEAAEPTPRPSTTSSRPASEVAAALRDIVGDLGEERP
ncbi:hypothetical protein GCM10027425_03050 [Alteromonas gracilis]